MKRRITKKHEKAALRKIDELLSSKRFGIDLCIGKDITVRSEYKASYDSKNNKVELTLIKSERL